MVIIDEAHLVAAPMWQEALAYFKASKVIKLTATPFRADKLEITNNPLDSIYEYFYKHCCESYFIFVA